MATAYVIHAGSDLEFVEKVLIRSLPSNGFDRWVSSSHPQQRSVRTLAMRDLMEMCQVILVVVSRELLDARSLQDEIAIALGRRRPTIAIRAAPLPEGALDRLLAAFRLLPAIDFTVPSVVASRELADLMPPAGSPTAPGALADVARPIEWNEEIFSARLAEAMNRHDRNRADGLVETFMRHLAERKYPYPPAHARRDLSRLRAERQFKLMRRYGETVLASGTVDAQVSRQLAQALIEQGVFPEALQVLGSIVGDSASDPGEVAEARGLIGRTYKQWYVDDPRAPEAPARLRSAIAAYDSVYSQDPGRFWHGINAASCIVRAHRDGVEGADPTRAREIAGGVLARIDELARATKLDVWDCATRVEALVVLERYEAASAALDAYITHPQMHAFEVSSTYRQFDQILELDRDADGRRLLERLWVAVERFRAGGFSDRSSPRLDGRESLKSVSAERDRRSLLIRVADPDWQPAPIADLVLGARLGTIVCAHGTEASVRGLLADSRVISVDESLPGGTADCDRSVPFIRATGSYAGPGGPYREGGAGALIAVIDDGIDVLHEAFLDAQGRSRIVGIWDQRDPTGPAPAGFAFGTFHDAAVINAYVDRKRQIPPGLVQTPFGDGHGTHVASIAAGRAVGAFAGGVAPEAKLLVVISNHEGAIGYSVAHIQALAFIDAMATALERPVVVNVSQGMNAGAHDGQSALEVAFDEFSRGGRLPGRVIVKSAGNERHKGGHAELTVGPSSAETLEWSRNASASPRERLELWWSSADEFRLQLVDPAGHATAWVDNDNPKQSGTFPGGVAYLVQFTKRHVDNGDSQLKIEISDSPGVIAAGAWRLEIEGLRVPEGGEIHAWIERGGGVPSTFQNHLSEKMTLSIPGTAQRVITVGAVDAALPIRVGAFSSYGPTRDRRQKPEVAAPGVGIKAAQSGSGTGAVAMDGTSMAAPHVTGAIALLFSRMASLGQPIPTATQIASALRQKTSNYSSHWDPGQGFGVIDVSALLAAF